MHIEMITLCDFAQENSGKLTVVGAFDSLFVRQTPAIHPHCSVAVRIRFESTESGRHQFRLAMIDQDGNPGTFKAEGELNVIVPPGSPSHAANFVVGLVNAKFDKLGTYSIDLVIDSTLRARIPFFIRDGGQIGKAA